MLSKYIECEHKKRHTTRFDRAEAFIEVNTAKKANIAIKNLCDSCAMAAS